MRPVPCGVVKCIARPSLQPIRHEWMRVLRFYQRGPVSGFKQDLYVASLNYANST
jgi:hypothetical protein